MSPSGKAAGSGPAIRGFESLHPSQDEMFIVNTLSWLFNYIEKDKTERGQCCGDAALFFVAPIEAIPYRSPLRTSKTFKM